METVEVSFDEFKRLDVRVGTIVHVERLKRTRKLYKILVDVGELGTRQTISSLVDYYTPEELLGKKVIFLANLRSAKFAGEVSRGMLLAAEKGERLGLLSLDRDVPNGARVT